MHLPAAFIRRGGVGDKQMIKLRRLRCNHLRESTRERPHTHAVATSRQLNDFFRKAKDKIVPAPNELL